MKLVSWNVNGLRACVKKGFLDYFHEVDADIFCLQETKLQAGQIDLELEGYEQYWNYAEKKGYSGTAVFTKQRPLSVSYGVGSNEDEVEGRIITLEFEEFYLVNVYTPNAKRDLSRLAERLEWEEEIRAYLKQLDEAKPVILCGDLNVAHQEIDLKNDKTNRGNSGFTDEERGKMTRLLEAGFVDSFRYFYPDTTDAYSWWSYMNKVRERNIGWRIDYFIVSERLTSKLQEASIHTHVLGSDHCPVVLELQ
ncbi:exodeoxyribonuclease III [Bacillus sp. FJAT-42315]|uniref:exodeoxyribonuclease III n=1 Tax=Bacillus sp. FJAT-42315 TaxID=2014077 RepID=UPI000C2347A4|nr:exodeoxyribonuclease III [Bacillus sp. FJAT-42315]